MDKVLVVAPHPDDETLGCGGALLRHKAAGDRLHWLIVTGMSEAAGYSRERMAARAKEIAAVSKDYGFKSVRQLGLPPAGLDTLPLKRVIAAMGEAFAAVTPAIVYLPYYGDVHSDHKVVFAAGTACAKSFRRASVRRLLAYETLSETDYAVDPADAPFKPNLFVDISKHLNKKLSIMKRYQGELGKFPFPRSEKAIRAAAAVRGAASGFKAAEAFMILKELA